MSDMTHCAGCGIECAQQDYTASYCDQCIRMNRISDLSWTMFFSGDTTRAANAKAELIAMGEYEEDEEDDIFAEDRIIPNDTRVQWTSTHIDAQGNTSKRVRTGVIVGTRAPYPNATRPMRSYDVIEDGHDPLSWEATHPMSMLDERLTVISPEYTVTITVTDDKGEHHCVHIGRAFDYDSAHAVADQAVAAYMQDDWLLSEDGITVQVFGPVEARTRHITTINDIFNRPRFHCVIAAV